MAKKVGFACVLPVFTYTVLKGILSNSVWNSKITIKSDENDDYGDDDDDDVDDNDNDNDDEKEVWKVFAKVKLHS